MTHSRKAALWLVAGLFVIGAILSWASIQGGGMSKWMPSSRVYHQTGVRATIPNDQASETLAQGARIQGTSCAGCHQREQRSEGPSFREIAARYQTDGDSSLGDLAAAVSHPAPGWSGYSPGPATTDLSGRDRLAVAYWILQSEGTN